MSFAALAPRALGSAFAISGTVHLVTPAGIEVTCPAVLPEAFTGARFLKRHGRARLATGLSAPAVGSLAERPAPASVFSGPTCRWRSTPHGRQPAERQKAVAWGRFPCRPAESGRRCSKQVALL